MNSQNTEMDTDTLPALDAETASLYLSPWLDGELDKEQSDLMAGFVAADPELAALWEQLNALNSSLPGAFKPVLDLPMPLALAHTIQNSPAAITRLRAANKPSSVTVWRAIAAVLVLALAGGLPASWLLGKQKGVELAAIESAGKFGWLPQIASYHRIYSSEQRHLVEVEADDATHIRTWLSDRLGRSFTIPDLKKSGYTFRGARMLVVNGERVAQLMYVPTSGKGRPLGFCFLKTGKGDRDMVASRTDELNLVSWRKAGYAYVVIGETSAEDLRGLAETAEAEMAI